MPTGAGVASLTEGAVVWAKINGCVVCGGVGLSRALTFWLVLRVLI